MNALISRFTDEPALVDAGRGAWFMSCIESVSKQIEAYERRAETMAASDDFWFSSDDWRSAYRPYKVKDGVLQIPVKGVLLHDFPFTFGSWATGYEYIWQAFKRGNGDPEVRGIALVIDSPGGVVAGCGECADRIVATKSKPVEAFAHESAYSAAYWIASTADKLTVSATGGVGSVGVVLMHVDRSAALADAGIKITPIYRGKHKVDGNSFQPLTAEAQTRMQFRIDTLYDVFVGAVAANRSMDEQAVRDTEADCFMATEALANGLADAIGPFDESLAAFTAIILDTEGDDDMAQNPAETKDTITAEQLASAETAARTTGHAEGVAAERARISAILGSESATTHPITTRNLALNTDMSIEAIGAALKGVPAEAAASTEQPKGNGAAAFAAAMGTTVNPGIGPDAASAGSGEEEPKPVPGARARAALSLVGYTDKK